MTAVSRGLRIAVLILLAVSSFGCVSFSGEFGTRIPTENLPRIHDGETTREEIIAWFGPPSAFFNPSFLDIILEDEEDLATHAPLLNDVYTYRYMENDTSLIFFPILFGKVDAAAMAETLTVFFDESGRVQYHAYRRDLARPEKNK